MCCSIVPGSGQISPTSHSSERHVGQQRCFRYSCCVKCFIPPLFVLHSIVGASLVRQEDVHGSVAQRPCIPPSQPGRPGSSSPFHHVLTLETHRVRTTPQRSSRLLPPRLALFW